jgi:hypothetical protein
MLSRYHYRFLVVYEGLVPAGVNLVLNGVIAAALFRQATFVPLAGPSGIVSDTLTTSFLLPLLSAPIIVWFIRRGVRNGTRRRRSVVRCPRRLQAGYASALSAAVSPILGWLALLSPFPKTR